MKKIILPSLVVIIAITIAACTSQQIQQTADAAKNAVNSGTGTPAANPLTNDEVISGLRDALTVGTNNSSAFASKVDGFYKNPSLFIPFPPEAQKVKDWAIKFGIIDAIIGIVICIIMMTIEPIFQNNDGKSNLNLRYELIFLIPYLIQCLKLRNSWENFGYTDSENISTTVPKEIIKPFVLEKVEPEKIVEEKINKEDHNRFMPK